MKKKEREKKAKAPKRTKTLVKVPDLNDYIGRHVVINGETIKIETLVGNVGMTLGRRPEDRRPQYAEVNGKYRISFLRLFAQMEGEEYTEEEFEAFEEMQVWAEAQASESEVNQIVDDVMKGKGSSIDG